MQFACYYMAIILIQSVVMVRTQERTAVKTKAYADTDACLEGHDNLYRESVPELQQC